MSLQRGFTAEIYARDYLKNHGLTLITSNYRCRWGEIDLIMQDGNYLIFVEVRARTSSQYGGAAGSITYQKQCKIIKTALYFLTIKKYGETYPLRFDVVIFQGINQQIEWIKNAFGSDY